MLGLRNEVGMKSNCWFETYIAVGVVRLVGRYSILEEVIRDNISQIRSELELFLS